MGGPSYKSGRGNTPSPYNYGTAWLHAHCSELCRAGNVYYDFDYCVTSFITLTFPVFLSFSRSRPVRTIVLVSFKEVQVYDNYDNTLQLMLIVKHLSSVRNHVCIEIHMVLYIHVH